MATQTTAIYSQTETIISSTVTAIDGTGQGATVNGVATTDTTLTGTDGDDVLDGTVIADDTLTTIVTQTDMWKDWDTINGTRTVHHHALSSSALETETQVTPGVEVSVDQTFVESYGTNVLTGGLGVDTFIFNINLHEIRIDYSASFDSVEATPLQTSGSNTNGVWRSYLSDLGEWRTEMYAQHGADDQAASETVSYTYSSGKTVKTGTATFDDSYAWHTTEWITNSSANTITDFGDGQDSIVLAGVTADLFRDHGGAISAIDNGVRISLGDFAIDVLGAITVSTAMDHITFSATTV